MRNGWDLKVDLTDDTHAASSVLIPTLKIHFRAYHIDAPLRSIRGDYRSECANIIVDQIKRIRRDSQIEHEFSIFWVPRRTTVSDQLLEEAGVLGEASVSEWPLYFVPLADDVLSLELDDAVEDLYLVCSLSKIGCCDTDTL